MRDFPHISFWIKKNDTKENLKTYMNEYRLLTDGVNVLDGFVINIGIDFEVSAYENYNKSELSNKVLVLNLRWLVVKL